MIVSPKFETFRRRVFDLFDHPFAWENEAQGNIFPRNSEKLETGLPFRARRIRPARNSKPRIRQ